VVALNKFETDTRQEIEFLENLCGEKGVPVSICEGFEKGGAGMIDLAEKVVEIAESAKSAESKLSFPYSLEDSVEEKVRKLAEKVYRASKVTWSAEAKKKLVEIEKNGWGKLPICVAKTQFSFSDDPLLLGAPANFAINISDVMLSAGASFIVLASGNIMRMPGLSKDPAAHHIEMKADGEIVGMY
jgi:formate--tetrahydrofolate ligase